MILLFCFVFEDSLNVWEDQQRKFFTVAIAAEMQF